MNTETKVLISIGIVTIGLLAGAVMFLSRPEKPVTVDTSHLVKADSLKISSDSAKLTIVEFGDFQCPACRVAHPGLKQAISEFPGKINFVFRHFPLPQHKNAISAAKVVEAANMQGKVWEMFDKLYDSQDEWAENDNPLEIFKKYAKEIGIDAEKLAQDMNKPGIMEKINGDKADGNAVGVNSTPSLFFNNELYKKGTSYTELKSEIESKLK